MQLRQSQEEGIPRARIMVGGKMSMLSCQTNLHCLATQKLSECCPFDFPHRPYCIAKFDTELSAFSEQLNFSPSPMMASKSLPS